MITSDFAGFYLMKLKYEAYPLIKYFIQYVQTHFQQTLRHLDLIMA